MDNVSDYLYLEMQNKLNSGVSEPKYLCECFERTYNEVCLWFGKECRKMKTRVGKGVCV